MHCSTQTRNIGWSWVEKRKILLDPSYQRESGIWSKEKQQLFIDSLVNDFDIPKIYFHDLHSRKEPYAYAVIDGKQRLSAIWDFLDNKVSLGDSFTYLGSEDDPPEPSEYFKDFSDSWQERFKSKSLDIVCVQDADEQDIEELFSRLNNGEALNAAEKRNAMGGDMCKLIRNIADHKFFKKTVRFKDKRFLYYDISAKFLKIEDAAIKTGNRFCHLKKKFLDELVKDNKTMSNPEKKKLTDLVNANLDLLCKVFDEKDPELSQRSSPQMYFLFAKGIEHDYAHQKLRAKLKAFFPKFTSERLENNSKEEDERDWDLSEYGRLSQQGTNDLQSMERRDEILRKFFLKWNPEVRIRDQKRNFSDTERYVLWIRSGKKCSICDLEIKFEEVEADHIERWSEGGKTIFQNARATCVSCNRKGNKPTK